MAVIYGRRRVGKTALIKAFIKDKPAIYIQGIEATKELNLQYLSDAIMDFENPMQIPTSFSFKDAFAAASKQRIKMVQYSSFFNKTRKNKISLAFYF